MSFLLHRDGCACCERRMPKKGLFLGHDSREGRANKRVPKSRRKQKGDFFVPFAKKEAGLAVTQFLPPPFLFFLFFFPPTQLSNKLTRGKTCVWRRSSFLFPERVRKSVGLESPFSSPLVLLLLLLLQTSNKLRLRSPIKRKEDHQGVAAAAAGGRKEEDAEFTRVQSPEGRMEEKSELGEEFID